MDEKLETWNKELQEAITRNDPARTLELKGWIEARVALLLEQMTPNEHRD